MLFPWRDFEWYLKTPNQIVINNLHLTDNFKMSHNHLSWNSGQMKPISWSLSHEGRARGAWSWMTVVSETHVSISVILNITMHFTLTEPGLDGLPKPSKAPIKFNYDLLINIPWWWQWSILHCFINNDNVCITSFLFITTLKFKNTSYGLHETCANYFRINFKPHPNVVTLKSMSVKNEMYLLMTPTLLLA